MAGQASKHRLAPTHLVRALVSGPAHHTQVACSAVWTCLLPVSQVGISAVLPLPSLTRGWWLGVLLQLVDQRGRGYRFGTSLDRRRDQVGPSPPSAPRLPVTRSTRLRSERSLGDEVGHRESWWETRSFGKPHRLPCGRWRGGTCSRNSLADDPRLWTPFGRFG